MDYFKKLKRAYDEVFLVGAVNVHVIDADHFDCLHDPAALQSVCSVIDSIRRVRRANNAESQR